MFADLFPSNRRSLRPWLAIVALLLLTILQLYRQGRLWICACGEVFFWSGDIWSSDNSQHLFDPYTFTHIEHGFWFLWILLLIVPKMAPAWQLWIALALESVWEIIENTEFIIQRYREVTVSLDYFGDTILNSVSDILICGLGFVIARQLGFRRTFVLFVVMEVVLMIWIRDSLILNILMLIYPIDAIKAWQLGG